MAKRLLSIIAFWLLCAVPAYAILPQQKAPIWAELTPAEQQALAPIAGEYDQLPDRARLRFQSAAKRYPKLSPAQQQRFQSQLASWAKMKPEERKKAREKYLEFKDLPPEKRKEVKEKWHKQEEEKKRKQQNPGNANAGNSVPPAQIQPTPPSVTPASQP